MNVGFAVTFIFDFFTGVTILLALSVYQIIVNDKLPASSDELPVIGNVLPTTSK